MEMTMPTNIKNSASQAITSALADAVQYARAKSLLAAAEDLEAGLATSVDDQDFSFLPRAFVRSAYTEDGGTRPPTKIM
jgi:hypothetical protein